MSDGEKLKGGGGGEEKNKKVKGGSDMKKAVDKNEETRERDNGRHR